MQTEATPPAVEVRPGHGGDPETVKRHPAFGLASFSRVNGGTTRLFGSELKSGSFIRFELYQAASHWLLHAERYHTEGVPIVQVELTAAQFAEMITTLNVGSGVPCTIRIANQKLIPNFKDEASTQELIKEDLRADTAEIEQLMGKLQAELKQVLAETPNLSGAKKERLVRIVARIQQQLTSNMPFTLDQYHRAVDKTAKAAKAEVDSFITQAAITHGIPALSQMLQPLPAKLSP